MSLEERFEQTGKSEQEIYDITEEIIKDATPRATSQAFYSRWAKTYDEDFLVAYDYKGPAIVADQVVKVTENKLEMYICDFGCGTGNGGVELIKRGYKNIDGLDANREMLEVAKSKGVYKKLVQGELGKGKIESIPDNTYDLLMGVGNIFQNHINESAFEELIRITKSGGNIVCGTMERTLPKNFEPGYKQLEGNGAWRLVTRSTHPNFFGSEMGVIFNFEVLPNN